MKFEKWFTKEREEYGKAYVMLGPFALRNIAMLAYEEGFKEGVSDTRRTQQNDTPDAKRRCGLCRGTGIHPVGNTFDVEEYYKD